ncbi:MAG TPA: hypothetical protein VF956_06630 [Candidatus Dormibacteraeota bacterium]
MRRKVPSRRVIAALAVVLVVAGLVAAFLVVFGYWGPITRGAQMNAWPESRIVFPGARLVATETKDKAPQSWLGGNDYNPAELTKTYEVDASVANDSVVSYYSHELSTLGWRVNAETTVTAPDAGFCKLPNLAAYIRFPATQRYTYTLQDVSANVACGS